MRSMVVHWMTRMIHVYGMSQETLFLAVNVMDRYLSLTPVSADWLQLLGIVALFIASKQVRVDCVCDSRCAWTVCVATGARGLCV